MAQFHELSVTGIRKTIRDAVVVTLKAADPDAFVFTQGQYLTFRRDFDGVELRRSYSICAGLDDGVLQVGIKKVAGGAFSSWANDALREGDVLEAMAPQGRFFTPLDPGVARRYLGFAGGSGITPVLSLIKTILAREPLSRFILVYANRRPQTIMFRDELEDLKNLYMERFSVLHVLESDSEGIDLLQGRVDGAKCAALFQTLIRVETMDMAFICGPEPMMLAIADALRAHGMREDQIRYELFASGQPGRAKRRAVRPDANGDGKPTRVTLTLDGAQRSFEMERDQSVLEAALSHAVDVPFACKAGVCSTCRCKLIEGEVEMVTNHALEDGEVARGYILSCQSYPLSGRVVVDYDVH